MRNIMIDRETVMSVARLARLGLSEQEVDTFGAQLSSILGHIQILQEVDVSGISPTAHASRLTNITREDVSRPSYPPEVLLANAPEQEENCLKVNVVLLYNDTTTTEIYTLSLHDVLTISTLW